MKHEEYINKDGSVSYRFRVYISTDADGTLNFARKTWKPDKNYTPKQLEKELTRQKTLFEEEVKSGNIINNTSTFKDFSDDWIEKHSKFHHKIKTTQSYVGMLKRINPAIGHIKLDKITPVILNNFLINLYEKGTKITDKTGEKSLSDKSVKNYYTLLSSILETAVKWKVLKQNPIRGITPPKVAKRQVDAFEKDDVKTIFQLLENAPLKYELLIKLAVLSGMRRGELMGLKWDAVDFENNLIIIKNASQYTPELGIFDDSLKNEGSYRALKMSSVIFDLLKRQKDLQQESKEKLGEQWVDKNYVFTQWNGKPMHPNTPYTWFQRFQIKNGLEPKSIHALRHTTATLLIMDGANVKMVSGRLGHTNTGTTTNTYTSYLKSADEMTKDALDNILDLK